MLKVISNPSRRQETLHERTNYRIDNNNINMSLTDSPAMANVSISPSSEIPSSKLLRRRSREVPKSPLSPPPNDDTSDKDKKSSKRNSAAAASIPGLSMFGSVGKKWEEIQKGET